MAVTMIPFHGAEASGERRREPCTGGREHLLSPSGVFVLRRVAVGVVLGLFLVIVGFAARPHLVAPDVRPASSVGSNQINVDTDGAALQLQRVNDATGLAGIPTDSASSVGAASTYTVRAGDSLWSIAAERVSGDHLDDYLAALVALNGNATLQPGHQLILPG